MSDHEHDLSDKEVAYHELFENAQKAIHISEANQKRSKAVREELEAYIDSASELKGSDGSALIRVPSNFETIVNSMNRDDLAAETNEEKPWSQYLLLDGLNSEDDKEYNGRYARSFKDTPDVKIKRGLAQIQLLDRQLQEITRANHPEGSATSPRADETFITSKHVRGEGDLSSAAKKEAKRDVNNEQGKKTTNNSNYGVEKDREQQRLAYLMGIDPEDEKSIEPYWDPELQVASDAIDVRLLAEFGRWDMLKSGEEQELTAGTATEMNGACDGDTLGAGGGGRKERKVDYLHELRAARLESERVQRLDSRIETCSSHAIEYEALLPKVPSSQQHSSIRSIRSSSSRWGGSSSSCRSTGRGSLVGDVLALPDPAEVQPERVVTYEDIQELITLLTGDGEGVPVSDCGASVFPSSPSPSPSASSPGCRSHLDAFSHDPFRSPAGLHSANTAPDSGQEGRRRGGGETPDGGTYRVPAVDKERIKALVWQHKKEIEALGRLRAKTQRQHHLSLPVCETTEEEGEGGKAKDEEDGPAPTIGAETSCGSGADDAHGHAGDRTQTERWLDLNEEVPVSTINAAHPAVAATGNVRRARDIGGGNVAGAVVEQLPPIPPQTLSHAAQRQERGGGGRSAPAQTLLDQQSKSQSASLATDFEIEEVDKISMTNAYSAVASQRPSEIGTDQVSNSPTASASTRAAGGDTAKKSLRLPRGLQQPQLSSTSAAVAAAAAAGSTETAKGGSDPRHGLTVFRAVNSELERQQLQQHLTNGARLVKKIGAVLTAQREAHSSSSGSVSVDNAAASRGHHPLYNSQHRSLGHALGNYHQRPHHLHLHHPHNQPHQEEEKEELSFELSPSSARRALKARNVLDSMSTSAGRDRTTPRGSLPGDAAAVPPTKERVNMRI